MSPCWGSFHFAEDAGFFGVFCHLGVLLVSGQLGVDKLLKFFWIGEPQFQHGEEPDEKDFFVFQHDLGSPDSMDDGAVLCGDPLWGFLEGLESGLGIHVVSAFLRRRASSRPASLISLRVVIRNRPFFGGLEKWPNCKASLGGSSGSIGVFGWFFIFLKRADRVGFEPTEPLWGSAAFQATTLGQTQSPVLW